MDNLGPSQNDAQFRNRQGELRGQPANTPGSRGKWLLKRSVGAYRESAFLFLIKIKTLYENCIQSLILNEAITITTSIYCSAPVRKLPLSD